MATSPPTPPPPAAPSQDELRIMAARHTPPNSLPNRFIIHHDASDFFRVDYNSVLVLAHAAAPAGRKLYLIRQNAREGRFGLEDEIKFWVKRAVDLDTGENVFVKIPFHERFDAVVGDVVIECYRSPRKESRILELVRDHPGFMHGFTLPDVKDNPIRILQIIRGRTFAAEIENLAMDHEVFFRTELPAWLDRYIECVRAIGFLHEHLEKHGDIRRDHILVDGASGLCRWIDFDFNYRHRENMFGYDIYGLGNILAFLVGQGDVIWQDLRDSGHPATAILRPEEMGVVFRNRVFNLRKVYPYLPERLNRILMHFSVGAEIRYETTGQLLADLGEAREQLREAIS